MVRAQVWQHDGEVVEVRWSTGDRQKGSAGQRGRARPQQKLQVHRLLDDWDYVGRWWLGERRRHYQLLEGEAGRVVEIYLEEADHGEDGDHEDEEGGRWWLSRISD